MSAGDDAATDTGTRVSTGTGTGAGTTTGTVTDAGTGTRMAPSRAGRQCPAKQPAAAVCEATGIRRPR